MSVSETLSDFNLGRLSSEWVSTLYSSDFKEGSCLPEEYTSELGERDYADLMLRLINDLKEVVSGINDSTNSGEPNERFSWAKLKDMNVDVKALLSFISVFIKQEIKDLNNDESRYLTFTACKLYINMIGIPGAVYFLVLNNALFEKVLNVFNEVSSSITASFGSNAKPKDKSTNAKIGVTANSDQPDESTEVTELTFSEEQKTQVLYEISQIIEDLSVCLNTLSFCGEYESLKSLVQMLVNLTRLEVECNILVNARPRPNSPGYIALKAYHILEKLCNERHGEIKMTVFTIMNSFLSSLILDDKNPKLAMNFHNVVKNHTFVFVKQLINAFGEEAIPGVLSAAQKLFHLMPEKTEIRSKALSDLTDLLELLPTKSYRQFVLWFYCFAFESSLKSRLNAVDLISKVIYISDKYDYRCSVTDNGNPAPKPDLLLRLLIGVLFSKCTDRSHLTRTKVFNTLAHLVLTNQKEIQNIINEVFINTNETVEKGCFNFHEYLSNEVGELPPPDDPLPSGKYVMKILTVFSKDDKVYVRKNALLTLSNICLLNDKWITPDSLKILTKSCRDISVMIRKQSAKCLSDLVLKYPGNLSVIESWVNGVFPLLSDSDVKSQEKIIEYAGNIILDNLTPYSKSSSLEASLPWRTLKRLAAEGKRMLFRIACRSWVKQVPIRFRTTMFKILETHIGTENNFAVWFFIVSVSEYIDFPEPDVIYHYYSQSVHDLQTFDEILSQLVIESLFLNCKHLSPSVQEELYGELKDSLMNHKVPVPLTQRSLDICIKLKKDATKDWCKGLVQLCEAYIRNTISPHCSPHVDEKDLKKHIFLLGEAIQCSPGVSKEVLTLLAFLIYPQFTLHSRFTPKKWKGKVSSSVRAISVVTLGKACLQSSLITKDYVSVFVSLLKETNNLDVVRNNAMIALSDLCVRFTSLIEDHLGDMCVTLRDVNTNVRLNSLKIITKLIKEDFIKLKGPLFFYLLMMLLDSSQEIKEYTEQFWINFVVSKEPGIMCHHFVPAIFFFNDFEDMEGAEKHSMSEAEKLVFCLAGERNIKSRAQVYKFMLTTMKDDHRFKVSNRICYDIFEEALDGGSIILDLKGKAVLRDAMYALASEEMRLENIRKGGQDEEEDEREPDRQQATNNLVMGIARKVFLTQVIKKNYIDTIMPIISKLKKKLRAMKSSLAKDLMICVRELVKDYKTEIYEIFASDPELAAEVEFDLRNMKSDARIQCEDYDHDLDLNLTEVRLQYQEMSMCIMSQSQLQTSIASNLGLPVLEENPESESESESESPNQPESSENQSTTNENLPSTVVENSLSPAYSM